MDGGQEVGREARLETGPGRRSWASWEREQASLGSTSDPRREGERVCPR